MLTMWVEEQAEKQLKKKEGPASVEDYSIKVSKDPPASRYLANSFLLYILVLLVSCKRASSPIVMSLKINRMRLHHSK